MNFFKPWEFPINTGNKILNNHFVNTHIMTDCTEDLDNQYIFTAIIVIRENNKHPGIKAIKDYINKNFVSGIEGEIIEDIAMELLDHTITENRPTTKGNSYFIPICYPTRKILQRDTTI